MSYTFDAVLDCPIDAAEEEVREALSEKGFGVLTEIDVAATFKKKLGIDDYRPYRILGACNPEMAHQAIEAEPNIGAMLPCNVILQQDGEQTTVHAVDPVASMQAIDNDELGAVATKVREMLKDVIAGLA
jgi:uncharacterized protein (DUF302 family)